MKKIIIKKKKLSVKDTEKLFKGLRKLEKIYKETLKKK
jgi:hypothetical protein